MLPDINNTTVTQKAQSKIAGLYGRVSTNRQEEQETIESQVDEIKNRVQEDGNVLPPENIFIDDGWTGEMLQRPGLDAMRDAAQEGRFQVLYVYDRGRLSRVFAYQEIIIEELINKEIEFVTLHDVKAVTAEERVLQAMQGVFHEYERVKIAERMRRGKLFKARNKVLINGHSLYGWNYIKKTDTEPAHYEINEDQARVVKLIYDWVGIERIPLREVVKRLYDLGIPPRKGKSKFWTKGPIVRMLRCESYVTGVIYYNKSEAVVAKKPIKNDKYRKIKRNSRRVRPKEDWIPYKVQPIINDYILYEKIQKILNDNQKYACKKRKHDYLLSGLALCECGYPRVGDGVDNSNFYYRCAERIYKFPKKKKCNSQGVNAVALDEAFWKELLKFINDPIKLKESTQNWLQAQANNDTYYQEKKRLESVIGKIIEEENRYAKAYGEGALEFEQFKDLMKDAKKRKETSQQQLDELNEKMTKGSINHIEIDKIMFEVEKIFKTLDLSNRFQVVRDIITKVILKGGNEVEVFGRVPLFHLNMGYEPISRNCGITKRRKVNTF